MTGAGTSAVFTRAVCLTEVTPERLDVAFIATTQSCPWPKAYGGDLAAAAASAAMRSITDGKVLHSMHSYFMRPAEIGAEVRYEVEILRDGRGYATRQVRALQDDKVIYVCLASFSVSAPGGDYAAPAPQSVPDPDSLPSSAAYLADRAGGTMTETSKEYWSHGRSFDMRHVPDPVYLEAQGGSPSQVVWVRPFDALRPVEGMTVAQRDLAALTYVCDYTILEPVLRMLGHPWAEPGLVTASLDHAIWFHRAPEPGDLDGWLLYAQDASAAAHGRGLGTGRFFTLDGRHLATVAQEGMIRASGGGLR